MDSISLVPSPKRQKLQDLQISCSDDNEDRISKLPDAILSRILSLLPAKDAERTGALSIRWKSLWAFLPDLELAMPLGLESAKNCNLNVEDIFINFVEKTLVLRNGLPLHRFRLAGGKNTFDFFARVYDFICTALSCGVEQLDLYWPEAMDAVRLPWTPLMNCRTLVELKLGSHFVLDVPTHVFFPSLKCLHLLSLIYSDDATLVRLFSGCPALEELKVVRLMNPLMKKVVDNVTRLGVSVPSLKRLVVVNLSGKNREHVLMVDASNLEQLNLTDMLSDNFIFNNLSSISEARLDVARFYNRAVHGNRVFGLLRSISAVKTLSLSSHTMETLGYANNNVLPTYYNLVHLSLELDEYNGWKFLNSFLDSMPNLEVLVFAQGLVPCRRWIENWRDVLPFEFNWQAPEVPPACLLFKLQTIEIRNDGRLVEEELMLIKYLLANAFCLKTMKIGPGRMTEKTLKKLASYRRGSDSCQIILLKH